ncbi:hypothetical protein PSHI8_17980 [Polynucleobacter sp. SHI8]|nr:hypothetical protein PSHI2_17970 [Polynucleobacter sp. SHI2]BDW14162.1 hypothetical protein PSHI8_17980 [Polynucleobacter sp. SHI8]
MGKCYGQFRTNEWKKIEIKKIIQNNSYSLIKITENDSATLGVIFFAVLIYGAAIKYCGYPNNANINMTRLKVLYE